MRTQPIDFAVAVLDSLAAHIAVLDTEGRIVAVNRAWSRFSSCNGGEAGRSYLGTNYLEVCARAARAGDTIAAAVVEGIRAMRAGERDDVVLEYPCNSPEEERWFILRITRCDFHEQRYLIVSHDDITARKRAEAAADAANQELRRALGREQQAARTDELTGSFNRRHFLSVAQQLFEVAHRYGRPMSVILLDVDHFKQINDRFGHEAGDLALKHLVRMTQPILRDADVFARYGGEEFVVLLPDTGLEAAAQAAERIRFAVSGPVVAGAEPGLRVTVSAGVAELAAGDQTLTRLIGRADEALYVAKQAGRNCVSSAAAEPEPGDGAASALARIEQRHS